MNLSKQLSNEKQNQLLIETNDSNNNSIEKVFENSLETMPNSGSSCDESSSVASSHEEDMESLEMECDLTGHKTPADVNRLAREKQLHKQFDYQLANGDHQVLNWSTPLSTCSLSSSSPVCCSPISPRTASPVSPTPGVPVGEGHYWSTAGHLPSTLTSIRDAVSHLTRLDDFNVVKLSQGFFSQVFKVTHHSTRKVMVLKMNKQAGNRGNALKEIELLNKLNNENIVAFMGTVVHEGGLHPLLEYINGGTLEKLIRQYYKIDTYFDENKKLITRQTTGAGDKNFNNNNNNYNNFNNNLINNQKYIYCPQIYRLNDINRTFVRLAEDVARGMDYLHSLHFLHRDLTSKNVLIRNLPPVTTDTDEFDAEPYLVAVIGDFGFATAEPTKDQKLPTVGSPYWLAPECIKSQWYNHKCDIFSYGVICCELNWRIPADPDYLCRDDNFLINFDKLPELPNDTLLAKVARLTCQKNASIRPEFSEILEVFESELMNDKNSLNYIFRRDLSLTSNSSIDSGLSSGPPLNGTGDIFDQHLIRRRNSQIEKKYFNGGQR